ncbi:hypothetical protein [Kineococcus sp. G2]|uniref:hypothetical protein n=1 Tax=Kineococcus sp. G2 TaxID=3127484 RepID=UPI00301C46CA
MGTTTDPDRDTPPGEDPAEDYPWMIGHHGEDDTVVQREVSRLQWAYVDLLGETVDRLLGLPDRDSDHDAHAEILEDLQVRQLRHTAALRLAMSLSAKVPEVLVTEARRAGASWALIGDAVDVSRQAARKRWSYLDVPQGPAVSFPRARDLLDEVRPRAAGSTVRPDYRVTT